MKRKHYYRIVPDSFSGYEAQYRPWWSPFWFQCNGTNTRSKLVDAEEVARRHAQRHMEMPRYMGLLP